MDDVEGLIGELRTHAELLRRQDVAITGAHVHEIKAEAGIDLAKAVVNLKGASQWAVEHMERAASALTRLHAIEGERDRLYTEKNTAKLGADGKWRERLGQLQGACSRAAIFAPGEKVSIGIPADLALDLCHSEIAHADADKQIAALTAERDAAISQRDEARKALEPFAEVGAVRSSDSCRATWTFDGIYVTDADFRNARSLLSKVSSYG